MFWIFLERSLKFIEGIINVSGCFLCFKLDVVESSLNVCGIFMESSMRNFEAFVIGCLFPCEPINIVRRKLSQSQEIKRNLSKIIEVFDIYCVDSIV